MVERNPALTAALSPEEREKRIQPNCCSRAVDGRALEDRDSCIEPESSSAARDFPFNGLAPTCVDLPLTLVGLPRDISLSFHWLRNLAVVVASLIEGWGKDDVCQVGLARLAGEQK